MLIGNSLQTFVFAIMNKRKEKQRVANGKHKAYAAAPNDAIGEYRLGDQAFMDLTDVQNDEVSRHLSLVTRASRLPADIRTHLVCVLVLNGLASGAGHVDDALYQC
jgi:hypothetical protein